ncbi:MAG: ABC transporter ATP-binding protein [Lachnospiraceae bacterium]|nr:ABC transporter ATP-binding protein [Lachnospiraceae bacterium]
MKKGRNKKGIFKIFVMVYRDCYKARFFLMLSLSILYIVPIFNGLTPLIFTSITQNAQDYLMGKNNVSVIWFPVVVFLVLHMVIILAGIAKKFLSTLTDQRCSQIFGNQLFEKTAKIAQIDFENADTYEKYKLAYRAISEAEGSFQNSLFGSVETGANLFCNIISVGIAVGIMASYSYKLIIFAIVSVVLTFIINIYSEKVRNNLRHRQITKTRRCDYFWSLFSKKESVKEMRVLNVGDFFKQKWIKMRNEMLEEEISVEGKLLLLLNLGMIVKNFFYGANIAISIFLTINQTITIAEFAGCLLAFSTLQGAATDITYIVSELYRLLNYAEDFYNFMSLKTEEAGIEDFGLFTSEIKLENVFFSYPNTTKYALDKVNLTIKKGEHVVIVGENGSGKTTLSKLLTGCFKPFLGKVLVDNQDISRIKPESVLKNFSVVSQNFIHYNMTLRENITISDISNRNNDFMLDSAIKKANLEMVVEQCGGKDVLLGKEFGGHELSGGQWQKIAIARGIFRDAPIIILDEPTSALDPLIEAEILERFMEMSHNKTSIIISHRVGVCRLADKIVVMKHGRVVEIGKHEELIKLGGEYTNIWNSQAKWVE